MLAAARKAGQRPLWLGESIWDELNRQWAAPEYRQLSEKAKQNRASDCGGIGSSLHTGGSIPHTEHRRRLKQALGRDPTMAELHARTHQRQNTQEWVDQRSQQTQETYHRVFAQRQLLVEQGDTSGSQTEASDDLATWQQVAGSKKKGRIYGIESIAQASPSSYSSCSVESVSTTSDAAGLSQKVDLLLSAFNTYKETTEARFALLLAQGQPQGEASAAPAEPVTEQEEEPSTESDPAVQ